MTEGASSVSERPKVGRVGTCSQMSQATSKNRLVNKAHFAKVEERERVFFRETALEKSLLNRFDSSKYGSHRVVHSKGSILKKRVFWT